MSRLMDYLPKYYEASSEVVEIQEAIWAETETEETAVNSLQDQMYIDTATADWGIPLWEKLYGIYSDPTLSEAERRASIIGKLRGAYTATPAYIKQLAEGFVDGTVNIVEDTQHYSFEVQIMDFVGMPPLITAMRKAIDEIKPAHLSFDIVIKYNTWNDVAEAEYTWDMASAKTWDALKGEAL